MTFFVIRSLSALSVYCRKCPITLIDRVVLGGVYCIHANQGCAKDEQLSDILKFSMFSEKCWTIGPIGKENIGL